jgi:hypothetical protein
MFMEGVAAVQRNYLWLLAYIAVNLVSAGAYAAATRVFGGPFDAYDAMPPMFRVYSLGHIIVFSAIVAAAAAIVFSRIGADVDRPLWRFEGSLDALRRFLLPWFILFLAFGATGHILFRLAAQADDANAVLLVFVVTSILAGLMIPIGACIMFHGRFAWEELGESLAPLVNQIGGAFFFFLVGMSASAFLTILHASSEAIYATLLIEAADSYLECVILAGVWLLCIVDRETESDDDDIF